MKASFAFLSMIVLAKAQIDAPTQAPTATGEVRVFVQMVVDQANATASNIGWNLAADTGDFAVSVPFNAYSPAPLVNDFVIAPGGENYTFSLKDRNGNGLGPDGSYVVSMGPEFDNFILASGPGNFTSPAETTFFLPSNRDQLPVAPTPAPTPAPALRPTNRPTRAPAPQPTPEPPVNNPPRSSAMASRLNVVSLLVSCAAVVATTIWM